MLTPAQNATLKAYINTVPAWAALPNNSDTAYFIAGELNLPANPAWIVWQTMVTKSAIMKSPTFDWTRVDNLSVGKARIWTEMFDNPDRAINPSQPNLRAGIDATWVGTQADLNVRASVYASCKRSSTLGEKVLSTGTGSDAVPAVMSFEGNLSYQDVQGARDS